MYYCTHWADDLMPAIRVTDAKSTTNAADYWDRAAKMGVYGDAFTAARECNYTALAQKIPFLCHVTVRRESVCVCGRPPLSLSIRSHWCWQRTAPFEPRCLTEQNPHLLRYPSVNNQQSQRVFATILALIPRAP